MVCLNLEELKEKCKKKKFKCPVHCYLTCNHHTWENSVLGLHNRKDSTLSAESKEELKSFLVRVKKESERASLKPNVKKTKIMANRWGEKMETMTDFIFVSCKITADGDCSH